MRFERRAGILLHPTSLPGKFGIGDMGYEAYNFVNFLEAAGQKLWQVFPLGPTGYGDSPYQCFSAFAGNQYILSPEKLRDYGFLSDDDLNNVPRFDPSKIDYGSVINYKISLNKKAYDNFSKNKKGLDDEYSVFKKENEDWLNDFSLFMAAKEYHDGVEWTKWDKELVAAKKKTKEAWENKLAAAIDYFNFTQFIFDKQWSELKDYANRKGIRIIGDIPIFVAFDSADVWSHREFFSVDKNGKLIFVAGVPPDYFSETGQLWGNPLFDWNKMENDDYLWWRKRIIKLLDLVDIIRIDHFRGFDAYWEIPGNASNAIKGRWVKGPGEKFFDTIEKHLGKVPIIAEDLGVITKSVISLREKFEYPGMKILQFAFGTGMATKFLPHNIPFNSVVYTGSHDNDTTREFFDKAKTQDNDIYNHARKYLNYFGDDITFELIRAAYRTSADTVIIPMQDILNLGGEARMNFPGTLGSNWAWRFRWDQVPHDLTNIYKELALLYERPPKPEKKLKEIEIEDP
ncbi:MAG: 4-alpha-glucanotransferase [Ignavibacteriaceae bacterium]|nr:4-alpha-glucanotransferase [Ignavibacteriaceae bacterium]